MTRQDERRRLRAGAAVSAALMGMLLLTIPGQGRAPVRANRLSTLLSATPASAECEGDACTQVVLTYDEVKGEYRAQNNSSDRWTRVSASNAAAAASACLAPGKSGALALKSLVGSYRADFAEARCGAQDIAE